ncbi:carboxypeptidase O [Aplysia californica]|uniref:Carboxypeptidase O n=1 Tax=Aplysia californica TaxID=6500 RepID=A0ABM0JW75_APLCA|nr:carboxypeptidase O [Aplysia californica]
MEKSTCIFVALSVLSLFVCSLGYDVKAQLEKYTPNYTIYHNISQINSDLSLLEKLHKDYITLSHSFKSRKGMSQIFAKISNSSQDASQSTSKTKILLVFGEHAREFFPVESMFYFLKNLTGGLPGSVRDNPGQKFSKWVLDNFDIHIICLANPDGRDYVEKSNNYCWRGTSLGVDINRNFDWNYGGKGSSNDPSDGEYRGTHVFSEPETAIFRKVTESTKYDAFLSFHSGIRHIYIPYADSKSRLNHRSPSNKIDLLKLASKMAKSSQARPFKYGLAYDLNDYTADGTSFDFMAGVRKIPFSFAVEMWQHNHHLGKSCFDEFNPQSEALQEELQLIHPLYVELLTFLHSWKKKQHRQKQINIWKNQSLARQKKDRYPRVPMRYDALFHSQSTREVPHQSASTSPLMYLFLLSLTVLFLVLGAKHICYMMRKKRVVNLRSLSSTFSMLKNL